MHLFCFRLFAVAHAPIKITKYRKILFIGYLPSPYKERVMRIYMFISSGAIVCHEILGTLPFFGVMVGTLTWGSPLVLTFSHSFVFNRFLYYLAPSERCFWFGLWHAAEDILLVSLLLSRRFVIGVSMFVVQRLVEMCAEASGMILQLDMISPCKFGVKTLLAHWHVF